MVLAIPKRFLPHSCTLVTESNPDIWGKCTQSSVELKNVRIDLSESVEIKDGVQLPTSGALLFYDAVNSSPTGVNFALSGHDIRRQYIDFGGREYKIEKIDYLYAADSLHHLEITLSSFTEDA
jgi:hypothetical protein